MTHVYLLQYVHVLPNGEEDVKVIGVYSTKETALAAVARLNGQPGFSRHPNVIDYDAKEIAENGFLIGMYKLDRDSWTEGFVTLLPSGEELKE
jgi:hypothetical protein